MANCEGAVVSENHRWTGKRKAEAVLDIIKGKVSLVDFCRANDLKQTDVEKWMDDFQSGQVRPTGEKCRRRRGTTEDCYL